MEQPVYTIRVYGVSERDNLEYCHLRKYLLVLTPASRKHLFNIT